MSTVLIIQSRRRPEMVFGEQGEYRRALADTGAEPVFISSLDDTLNWSEPAALLEGVDAIILGGSGEFDFDGGRADDDEAKLTSKVIVERLRPLITYVFEKNIPTLGICYGHQIIGEALGVRVVSDSTQKKVGSYPVVLNEVGKADPLFAGMPEQFIAQYGHKDSLSALPAGATLLAETANCRFSALRYTDRIYTVQFHPELTAADVANKLRLSPGYLPEGVDPATIAQESPEASTLIPKFIRLSVG